MGSSRRLSCRQHTAARQAAGHAARLGPHGLCAMSEKGRNRRRRAGPAPFYPTSTVLRSQTKEMSRASGSLETPRPGLGPHSLPAPPRSRRTLSQQAAPPDPSTQIGKSRLMGGQDGAWGRLHDGERGLGASRRPLPAPRRDGARKASAPSLQSPPPLGARPGGRSTVAPPAAAACGAPWGAGTCVQAAHPDKHPLHLK